MFSYVDLVSVHAHLLQVTNPHANAPQAGDCEVSTLHFSLGHVNFLSAFFFFLIGEKAFSSSNGLKTFVISQCFELFELCLLYMGVSL